MAERRPPKAEPNCFAVLEGIERQLKRIADKLGEPPAQTRWYQASWEEQEPYGYAMRKRRAAFEGYSLEEVQAQLKTYLAETSDTASKVMFTPLRYEQCKYCCASDWHEDGVRCRKCGMSEEQALLERREGRSYPYPYP